jgi:DNA-binding HxlR family transcriptional regulator
VKKEKNKPASDLKEEIDLLSTMLESLVQLLEEKGILTQEEWEQKIKKV